MRQFIDSINNLLSDVEKVKSPSIAIGIYDEAYFDETLRTIWLPSKTPEWWNKNKELTKKFLKWTIAHEFKHYLQFLDGKTLPKTGLFPRLRRRPRLESEADKYAEQFSGITSSEWKQIVVTLYH